MSRNFPANFKLVLQTYVTIWKNENLICCFSSEAIFTLNTISKFFYLVSLGCVPLG